MSNISTSLSRWLMYCGACFIGFSYFREIGGTIYDIMFLFSFVVWAILGFRGANGYFFVNYEGLGAGLVLVGFVLSLLETSSVADSVLQIFKFVVSFLIAFFLIPSLVRSRIHFVYLLWCISFSGFLNGLGAIVQYLTGSVILGGESILGRMTGFTEHPNELGFHAAFSTIVSLYLLTYQSKYILKIYSLVFSVFGFAGLILSSSITAVVSLVMGLVVVATLDIKEGGRRWVRTLGLLFLILIIAAPILLFTGEENNIVDRILAQKDLDTNDGTLGVRFDGYLFAIDRILDNPFIGVGNAENDTLSVIGDYVHNMFLRAFREGGVLSFLGFVLIFFRTLARLVYSRENGFDAMAIMLVGVWVVVFIGVSLSPAFFQRVVWIPFGLIASYVSIFLKTEVA